MSEYEVCDVGLDQGSEGTGTQLAKYSNEIKSSQIGFETLQRSSFC